MTVQNYITTSVGAAETVLIDENKENDYGIWIDYSNMVSGDEFLCNVIITLNDSHKSSYYSKVIDYKTIKKGDEPLRYLPATTCKGIKVTLQKIKDGKNNPIAPTDIGHQLITYQ